MIEVSQLRVSSTDIDHLDLSWELVNTDEELERYDFYVLRSVDGAGGPYEPITGPFRNTYLLRDPNVDRLNKWRLYFYKLKVVHKDSGDVREFGPAWLEAEPDLIALEIQRRHLLVLQEFNGRKLLLFPQLTSGQRCPRCFDRGTRGNSIGRQTTQNCLLCFDTSFVGGFASPILIYGQIDPSPLRPQKTETAEMQAVDTTARVSAFPPVRPRDMLIEAENIRWRVEQSTPTRKLRAIVHQELQLHELPVSSIRYRVPVNIDLLNSAAREYTRPMNIDFPRTTGVGDKFGDPQ